MSTDVRQTFHIPSLDGVRAVAVLIVFIGHGQTVPSGFPGHAGVTIFFFLSGYLIVSLLRREHERSGSISMPKFYLRRLLRIAPPALLAIATSVLLAATGAIPANVTPWGVLAEVFNYTNYYIVIAGRDGLPPETTQFWSLAVEEHYYLVIPVLLLLLFRARLNARRIGVVLLAVAAVVPIWRIVLGISGAGFDRLYTSTDTRIDSMLIGSAMAMMWNPMFGDRMPRALSGKALAPVAGVAVVVFALTTVVPSQAFRLGVADTIQCICLLAVFAFIVTRSETPAGRVLNHPWVVRLGVLSFSVYLFHKMIYALVQTLEMPSPLSDGVTLILTIVVAELIYRCIETPAGRLRKRLHA